MIPPLTLTIDFSDRVVSVLEMLCGRTLTTRDASNDALGRISGRGGVMSGWGR